MANKRKKQKAPKKAAHANVPTMAELKQSKKQEPINPSAQGGRETVDALVIAIVLAFFIRTFTAEAFVIPTGSMAPTLMGAHKDVTCDQCGQRFRVNASEEGAETIASLQREVLNGRMSPREAQQELELRECVGGVCPECGYVMPIRGDKLEGAYPPGVDEVEDRPTYSGDRLVVSKFAYEFADPKRWDVIVFKYPGDTNTNYIKRLVGLPNEDLRIYQGDLFVKPKDSEPEVSYSIARKPADVAMVMRQLVHDTDRFPKRLFEAKWPFRWVAEEGWDVEVQTVDKNSKQRYLAQSKDQETHWIRYHHTPTNEAAWLSVLESKENEPVFEGKKIKPALITDYTAYNSRILRNKILRFKQYTLAPLYESEVGRIGVHWTGDLMLEAEVDIKSTQGTLSFDLVESGDHYRCEIDLTTGTAEFLIIPFEGTRNQAESLAKGMTSIRGSGTHQVRLSNFDDQLMLWVDGQLIDMDGRYDLETELEERRNRIPKTSASDLGDLAPAGIGVQGAKVEVERIRLYRDIYYIADSWERNRAFVNDLNFKSLEEVSGKDLPFAIQMLASTPDWWAALKDSRHADFGTEQDQFFMMGDNSAESLDSRLWFKGNGRGNGRPGGSYLERSQLVGKAICVYWPHAWYSLPFTNRFVPVWPNFGDMRIVR